MRENWLCSNSTTRSVGLLAEALCETAALDLIEVCDLVPRLTSNKLRSITGNAPSGGCQVRLRLQQPKWTPSIATCRSLNGSVNIHQSLNSPQPSCQHPRIRLFWHLSHPVWPLWHSNRIDALKPARSPGLALKMALNLEKQLLFVRPSPPHSFGHGAESVLTSRLIVWRIPP